MGERDRDGLLIELEALRSLDGADPVEEQRAHAQVQAELFKRSVRPVALGRYVLLHPLGSGGAGTVYSAYDPDLHRRVAVKIVKTGAGSDSTSNRERLLREAQVVASLSHPNIVGVHDVGVVPDGFDRAIAEDGVYIVMELVEGENLRDWLGQKPRGWTEILDVLVAAGRGLAAAHAEGIVHRDVKPLNLLVGRDDRVRVLDFGLARAYDDDSASRRHHAAESAARAMPFMLDEELTEAGTVMGTPPYMAPEQHAGMAADARADQYAFCVVAYEALFGVRPFRARTLEALEEEKRRGPDPPPAKTVPRWLSAAILRGLAPEPTRRFASMDALLLELERPRHAGRRVRLAAGGVLVSGFAIVAALILPSRGPVCDDAAVRLRGVWDADVEQSSREAFTAVGPAYAEESWSAVASTLDAYAMRWSDVYRGTCDATLSPEAFSLRTLCLERRLDQLGHLARLLQAPDATVVGRAPGIARDLADPRDCIDARKVDAEVEIDLLENEGMLALDSEMSRASILFDAGRYAEALVVAREVAEGAEAIGADRLHARALILQCRTNGVERRFDGLEELCHQALAAAEKSGVDRLAIAALLHLAATVGQPDQGEGADWLYRLAWTRIQALPEEERTPQMLSWWYSARGLFDSDRGHVDAALASLERSLEVLEGEFPPDDPELLPALNNLGVVAAHKGKLDRARVYYERALATTMTAYGEHHPRVAMVSNNLGALHTLLGRPQEAVAMLERALSIKVEALGKDSPLLATTHLELARAYNRLERFAPAAEHAAEAMRLHGVAYGDSSDAVAVALAVRAEALQGLGRCGEVLPRLQDLERVTSSYTTPSSSEVGDVSFALGQCLRGAGDDAAAQAAFERALAAHEQLFGSTHRRLVEVLLALGGRDRLLRARRIVRDTEGDPGDARRVERALERADG